MATLVFMTEEEKKLAEQGERTALQIKQRVDQRNSTLENLDLVTSPKQRAKLTKQIEEADQELATLRGRLITPPTDGALKRLGKVTVWAQVNAAMLQIAVAIDGTIYVCMNGNYYEIDKDDRIRQLAQAVGEAYFFAAHV